MRTVEEIQSSILAEKANQPDLAGLTSGSGTAIYRLWAYVVAVSINLFEQLLEVFKVEVNDAIDRNIWGTSRWYVEIAKKFQVGDSMVELPGNNPYEVVDEVKQIVTRASFREGGGVLTLKVAKGDVNTPEALSAAEKAQFGAYINKIKAAGTEINVISLGADSLIFDSVSVTYNAVFSEAAISTNVEQAIKSFLFDVPFDGVLYKNKLVEAIEDVEGVINVDVDNAIIRAVQGANSTLLGTSYEMIAGYAELDVVNSNITYVGE